MARLKTLGAEENTTTAGVEITGTDTGTNCTIQTSVVRTGTYAYQAAAGGVARDTYYRYVTGVSDAQFYGRVYIYVAAAPTADARIVRFMEIGIDTRASIRIKSDRTLILTDSAGTQIGSPSSALSLNTWYRVDLMYKNNAPSPDSTMEARLDGVVFATTTTAATIDGTNAFVWGNTDGDSTLNIYFDDIAVNDTSGSAQTSYPNDGKVLYLRPNAAGDINTFATQTGGTAGAANNFTRVDEVTPNDATDFNGSSTLNEEDLFNFGNSGIGASDTVNVVEVHGRFRNSTADATAKVTFEIEKTSGGTKTSSAAITPNSTTWRTNVAGTTEPKTAAIVTYTDPDGAAWTQSTLDSLQAGYKLTTGPGTAGRRIDVTAVWVVIDYTPGAAPAGATGATLLMMGV
jgi:hypothetical protein